jgi:hypothetical protein
VIFLAVFVFSMPSHLFFLFSRLSRLFQSRMRLSQQSVEKYFTEITDTVRVLDELQSGLSMAKEFEMVLAETGKLLKHRSTQYVLHSHLLMYCIDVLLYLALPFVAQPPVCGLVFHCVFSSDISDESRHSFSPLSPSAPSLPRFAQISPNPNWSPTSRPRRRALDRAPPQRSPRNFRGTCLVPT